MAILLPFLFKCLIKTRKRLVEKKVGAVWMQWVMGELGGWSEGGIYRGIEVGDGIGRGGVGEERSKAMWWGAVEEGQATGVLQGGGEEEEEEGAEKEYDADAF